MSKNLIEPAEALDELIARYKKTKELNKELLAALKLLVNTLAGEFDGEKIASAHNTAYAVIKKAEGR